MPARRPRRSASPAATLEIVDDQCSAEGGAKAANDLVAAKVSVVVGFLCTESIEAAMPILKDSRHPGDHGRRAHQQPDRPQVQDRLAGVPAGAAVRRRRHAAVASTLTELWRQELFAIIDDGTIYGRELAETLRSESERAGLTAVYVDQFRPQLDNQIGLVGRLRKAGATDVFVGGDRDDIAILGRDAAKVGYDLTIAAGETLRAAAGETPLKAGTLMIGLPEWADTAPPAAVRAIRSQGAEPEGYALPAYAAVEIANAANADAEAAGGKLLDSLGKLDFTTVIGTIKFDDKGDLSQSPYKLYRFDGTKFVEADLP